MAALVKVAHRGNPSTRSVDASCGTYARADVFLLSADHKLLRASPEPNSGATVQLICVLHAVVYARVASMRDPRLDSASPWIPIATQAELATSARHVVGLRSWRTGQHQSVLIYRQDPIPSTIEASDDVQQRAARWYSIANECPHLGLPLEGPSLLLRLAFGKFAC